MGPKIDVRVTRGGKTLPIASVPNLQAGDVLWLHPDFPASQSAHYLMVVAFLRGTTNPPPEDWFGRFETWNKKVREEGVEVTVPGEAQQVILFLAPETGGDFSTLKSAVRGRPGIFVRASQDLNEAGFEQARIEKYLEAMRQVPPGDAKALQEHSNLLARTLALKPNPDCFKQQVDQQFTCLTQSGNQTLLDDGHAQTVVAALTNGPGSDFINQASYTRLAGAGMYSAYVGAIVDLGRILANLHTAVYQYIPAIAFPQQEAMNLKLNTPPSFHNPKSVIVIGLPAVQKPVPPPLRPEDPKHVACLVQPGMTIGVEGAPLVFSTALAHDMVLHLSYAPAGAPQDLPLRADAYQGGLVLATEPKRRPLPDEGWTDTAEAGAPKPAVAPAQLTGTVKGFWGFDAFTGPTVELQDQPGKGWKVLSGEPLIAGKEDHVVLGSTGDACLSQITFDSGGHEAKAVWKAGEKDGTVDVALPLKAVAPGSLDLGIMQYGKGTPIELAVKTYSEPAKLDGIVVHAGDRTAVITGQHLGQVKSVEIDGAQYRPVAGTANDALTVALPDKAPAPPLRAGDQPIGHVALSDGRVLDVTVKVTTPRPSLTLRRRSTPSDPDAPITLVSKDDLRVDAPMTIVLKSAATIPRTEQIEVGTVDGTLSAKLDFASGALVLQDAHTLRVTFDPLKAFGASVFGPVRLRAIEPGLDPGDWIPLATLVRLPKVSSLTCPADTTKPCDLTGQSLFLIDAVAPGMTLDQSLTDPQTVPEDFTDTTLQVPRPQVGPLYLELRDDHAAVATLNLPVQIVGQPAPPKGSHAQASAKGLPLVSAPAYVPSVSPAPVSPAPDTVPPQQ
jgi:hypothetical protein